MYTRMYVCMCKHGVERGQRESTEEDSHAPAQHQMETSWQSSKVKLVTLARWTRCRLTFFVPVSSCFSCVRGHPLAGHVRLIYIQCPFYQSGSLIDWFGECGKNDDVILVALR